PDNWVINATGTITNGGVINPPPPPPPPVAPSVVVLSVVANTICGSPSALTFSTSNEHNILKYDIEYSTDSISFVAVGTQAATNNNAIQQYGFSHTPSLNGVQFYRIKIYDSVLLVRYSNVVSRKIICKPQFSASIGPVPARSFLNVRVNAIKNETAGYSIHNMIGEVMQKSTMPLLPGQNSKIINLAMLAPGTYIFTLFTNESRVIRKFIVQ
ncbi:MAG: T9SS type A sorting domain-containing protein, partial [Ferruginibacter sp.]